MSRTRQPSSSRRQRIVGVATEHASVFGRSILRGVIQHAKLQQNWILHTDMWRLEGKFWPDCDGTIIGGLNHELFRDIKKRSRRLVSCSGNYDLAQMPVVRLDDDAAGAMAAQHLIDRGLKHFGLYCPRWLYRSEWAAFASRESVAERRARGFEQTVRQRGFSCHRTDVTPEYQDFLTHRHHPRLIEWVRSLPTPIGIMAVDDTHAQDLNVACREGRIAVPDHVAIIGVNNDELLCESASPPLSSVECNFTRMGYQAAKTLDRMMRGEKLGQEERLVQLPPVHVQQRMSTDIFAVAQPEVADAIRYIREHACDPCTVKDLMRVVPISRRTLERQFHRHLGRSLHDEIVRVRAEAARRLLLRSDLSMEEVAEKCGFDFVPSFNRFFNQTVGIPPGSFRRRNVQIAHLP